MADEDVDFRLTVTFEKSAVAPTGNLVRGWASVTTGADGATVVDDQDDRLHIDNLRKVAHAFMTDSRVAKVMHDGKQVGEVVGGVVIDDDFAKAVGMTSKKRGLWVDYRIDDPDIQKRAAAGEFKGFSIGGKGRRVQKQVQ